jgi:hypothetical protein
VAFSSDFDDEDDFHGYDGDVESVTAIMMKREHLQYPADSGKAMETWNKQIRHPIVCGRYLSSTSPPAVHQMPHDEWEPVSLVF